MKIRYYCYFGRPTGFARAAHDYIAALTRHTDAEVQIQPLGNVGDALEQRYSDLRHHLATGGTEPSWPDVSVIHAKPALLAGHHFVLDEPKVALTTWETNHMPSELAMALAEYDALITPSSASMAPLSWRCRRPGYVVPHCFDPDFWTPGLDTRPKLEPFTFYSLGAGGARKNTVGLLRAYLHRFRRCDGARLIIIVPPDTAMEPYHTAIATSGIAMDELPEIQIINERLSGPQLRDLHRGGACYVSAARGEAWGLGAFEAAVMGRPIVAAVVGGMDEYLEGLHIGGEYSRLYSVSAQRAPCFADAHDVSIETDAQGRRVLTAKAALPAGVDCGQTWADPDLCELADAMRLAMNDVVADGWPDTEFDRSALEKKFSYAAVGPQLYRTLQRIIDDQN